MIELYNLGGPCINRVTLANFENYLRLSVNYNYIKHGNKVYIQTVGVTQGGIASSELANLYLHYYKSKVVNVGYVIYRYNDDINCFITDINCLNINFDHFPTSLEPLGNINHNYQCTNFLDLKIELTNCYKIIIDLYDKSNSYNFKANRLHHYSSLLHNSVFRNIIKNELFRIIKICTNSNTDKYIISLNKLTLTNHYPIALLNKLI